MEDDLNFFLKEDKLKFFENGRRTKQIMQPKTIKSKNNNIFYNGRRPQFLFKGR